MIARILDVQGVFSDVFGHGTGWLTLLQVFSSEERMHLPSKGEEKKTITQCRHVSAHFQVPPYMFYLYLINLAGMLH
jgi:hypothetical protein